MIKAIDVVPGIKVQFITVNPATTVWFLPGQEGDIFNYLPISIGDTFEITSKPKRLGGCASKFVGIKWLSGPLVGKVGSTYLCNLRRAKKI
jgi:hypothetical protein